MAFIFSLTSIHINKDSDDSSNDDQKPSLEAMKMLIKAKLNEQNRNRLFPDPPSSMGNTALYTAIVRHDGTVIGGRYVLDGVSPDQYSSITCNYFDENDFQFDTKTFTNKPGYCIVIDRPDFRIKKLQMLVNGIYGAPTGGKLVLSDVNLPPGVSPDLLRTLGVSDASSCFQMNVDSTPNSNVNKRQNPSTGELIWNIIPNRYGANSFLQLRSVYVTSTNSDILGVVVTPYIRQNDNQLFPSNPISGQINTKITGFPSDSSTNIDSVDVKMSPLSPYAMINIYGLAVTVEFCTNSPNLNSMNNIQPYYVPNYGDPSLNSVLNGPQSNTRTVIISPSEKKTFVSR